MSDKIIHIHDEDSEADTCRKEVLPKLYESQWSDDLILEQRTFTDGKIIAIAIANIKHVTVYPHSNVMTGILGVAVGMASFTSLTLGGAALVGGIATLGNSVVLGVGLLGISVPLIYYGLDLYFMLKKAGRRKIKLNKGWTVSTPGSGQ